MNATIIYLLKVSLAISLVALPYYAWLRKDAALNVKRFYLLGGIVLSWLFPLLSIQKPAAISTFTNAYLIDPYASAAPGTLPETGNGISFSLFSVVLIIYIMGLLILALRHLLMFRKLKGIDRKSDNKDKSIVYTNSEQIFTLFSKIFIPGDLKSSRDLNSILIHEKAHLQQLHAIDLLIAESTLLLTWFNPFSWLISRMIKENHEHLADRSVLSRGVNPAHYKAQLLNHAVGVELFSLGNQFNHSLTKKRFQMMKKIKSPKKGYIKYLALIPAIIISLGLFTAASSAQQKTYHGKVVFEDGSPATGASIIVAGSTFGTVADRDGTFSLELDGNAELFISYVGYKTERIYAKALSKGDIVLHPTAYEMDLKDIKASDPSENIVKITARKSEKESGSKIIITTADGKDIEPVYVLDGKVVEEIESLDPDDIEYIAVVKDATSPEAKKYNAENGLIMITTKEKTRSSEEVLSPQEQVFYVVENMPSFPGGKEKMKGYIIENQVYPEKAKNKGLTGEVFVGFIVNGKGELKNIEVKRSSDKIFDEAAMNIFRNMPVWSPGKQRGKAVNVNIVVPVRFTAGQE